MSNWNLEGETGEIIDNAYHIKFTVYTNSEVKALP